MRLLQSLSQKGRRMADCINTPERLLAVLEEMEKELVESGLEVILVPAPDPRHCGHKIRASSTQNPDWYKSICDRFPQKRDRKLRGTYVKRDRVLKALRDLIGKGSSRSRYAAPLIEEAELELEESLKDIPF